MNEQVTSWCWLALAAGPPPEADASAPARVVGGERVGHLAVWCRRAKPLREARRADARILDPHGAETFLSLVLTPPGMRLPFDDLAVQEARRKVLADPPADIVTTLLRDASHFEGSLTARRGAGALEFLRDDPFARVFPARLLQIGSGLLGSMPAPAGPSIERYGSAQPWPWDRFPETEMLNAA
jgi:hypothetical protein